MKIMTQLKLFIVGLLILCPNILLAKHVSEETARKVAVNQMNMSIQAKALRREKESAKAEVEPQAVAKMSQEKISETFTATKDDIVVYYVFNFSPEGWAIISADDVAYPVIGYSDTGYYDPNISNQPPAFIDWMDNVAAEIAAAVGSGLSGLPDAVEAWEQLNAAPDKFEPDLDELAKAEEAGPLIRTKWGQGKYTKGDIPACCVILGCTQSNSYNKYCPWEYTGWTHVCKYYCPTGCTATAMAQVMKYWQWPPFGRGSHKYDAKYSCSHQCDGFKGREVNFRNRYYNWSDSSMPLKKSSDAIALLMRDIGVAVEMDYTPSVSGAVYGDALQKYFRYESGDYNDREGFSDADWIDKIEADLDNGRPILYVGFNKNHANGHAFICDGYDWLLFIRFFHFNWGWDGLFDGWFLLDLLIPLQNFSYYQSALFSLEPEQWGTVSIIYVDDDYTSDGYNDGHTWNVDAFNNINDAIVDASYESTIYVAAGTYYESIDLKGKAIHLYAVSGPTSTIINGGGAEHVVKCVRGEDASTVIEGFTITGGNANGSNPDDRGGGMYNDGSSPTVTNCMFINNSANAGGGGMCNNESNPTVTNCIFSGNSAEYGAGMWNNYGSSPTVINSTFTNNTSSRICGMFNQAESNPVVTSCIFWSSTASEIYNYNSSSPTVTYSNVRGGYSGTGNIDADPCFVEAGFWDVNGVWIEGDYRLLENSPCIDAGNPNYSARPNETDLDGNPRIYGDRIDMGAYEFTILNTAPVACIVGGDRVVEAGEDCEGRVVLDGSCSSDADSTEGTNDDINDFDWYEVIDACEPNSYIFIGSGEVIECNLGLGEHLIILKVTDKVGPFDGNEVVITVEDSSAPVIMLNGAETVVLECGVDSYTEEGATATDNCDEDVAVLIGGDTVDTSTCGTYMVTYDAADSSGNAAEQIVREVIVEDTTGPVIALNGSGTVVLECGVDEYVEEGATATDNCEDDVTVVIGGDVVDTSSCGTYAVTYDATDSWGNQAEQVVREVIVEDTTGPVITLNGSGTVVLECGIDSYVEEGATATDNCDDDVTVVTGGDVVDTGSCGTYVVTYDATDDSGNEAEQVVRTVVVEDTTPPELSVAVEPNVLWPPNGKMVEVRPEWEASDNCDEEPEVSLVDISMSVEDDINDYVRIGDDGSVYLRAAKSKRGGERIYTLTYRAVDDSGNATEASTVVTVPHSSGPRKLGSGLVRRLRRRVYYRGGK